MENISSVDGKAVKWIQSDSSGDFIELGFGDWVKKRGAAREVTNAYSPEWNG